MIFFSGWLISNLNVAVARIGELEVWPIQTIQTEDIKEEKVK
jgi:hypothetical protein